MGGAGEVEDPVGKRADVHSLHRRSKSASDRNVGDASRLGVTNFAQKHSNLPYYSPASRRTYGSQTPPRGLFPDPNTGSSNHRASLEKDIQLLQLRLQQEKSMRCMLEGAIGRASSTLSPGHRHFGSQAQTKELIAEIELLEEEVVNREQRVLSLYRNIFEQCASRPPSEQSSGLSSPAQAKMKPRKHPSIIKSAFCSSKKFPLQPFRVLSLKSSSENKEMKTRHAPVPAGKSDVRFEKPCSNLVKEQHYVSKLHFFWPQLSCLSNAPGRASRVVLVSYKDETSVTQKFALRFSTNYEVGEFVTLLEDSFSNKQHFGDRVITHSSHSEVNDVLSEVMPTGASQILEMNPIANLHPPKPEQSHSIDMAANKAFEGYVPALPPRFTTLVTNCSEMVQGDVVAANTPSVTLEADLKSLIVKYVDDASFLAILSKAEEVIAEMGGDNMRIQ